MRSSSALYGRLMRGHRWFEYDEMSLAPSPRQAKPSMLKKPFAASLLAILLLLRLSGGQPGVARADDIVGTSTPPVLTIHSTGGAITITSSEDSNVRVTSGAAQHVRISRFSPDRFGNTSIMLPERSVRVPVGRGFRTYHLPARQFNVPMARFGSEGVNVENPGGDMSIAVPKHVGAIFVNAESGSVAIEKLRGPYIISAGGDVNMRNVVGRGLIRTTSGNITLGGVGGDVHVQTASGAVTVYASYADRADVTTEDGPITWRFARLGDGAYRFNSKQGAIHLGFRPGVAGQVDAQSDSGTVQNLFAGSPDSGAAAVRVSSQHALSIAVNGGGPQITATTTSGDISVEPVSDSSPQPHQ
jgi:hypothetical protein